MAIDLMSQIKKAVEDNNLGIVYEAPIVPIGIDVLDYRNGCWVDGKISIGFPMGKPIQFISKPGVAKTTIAIQAATYICSQIEGANCIHYDFERSTKKPRILTLSGWDDETFDAKYMHLTKQISTDSVYDFVKTVKEIKLGKATEIKSKNPGQYDEAHELQYHVDNPFTGEKILAPTILLIDSLSTMIPRQVLIEDEMSGNMTAASIARRNASFFRELLGDFLDASITPIIINHLTQKISIDPRRPVSAEVNYLAADEGIPGGKVALYLTDSLIKLVARRKLSPEKEFGVKGYIVEAILVKSRSNTAGVSCNLVFDQRFGINNTLSNYLLMKDMKVVKGAGRSFYLETLPNKKFAQKDLLKLYKTDEEFKIAFDNLAKECLIQFVPDPANEKYLSNFKHGDGEVEIDDIDDNELDEKEIARIKKFPIEEFDMDDDDVLVAYYDKDNGIAYDIETFKIYELT